MREDSAEQRLAVLTRLLDDERQFRMALARRTIALEEQLADLRLHVAALEQGRIAISVLFGTN